LLTSILLGYSARLRQQSSNGDLEHPSVKFRDKSMSNDVFEEEALRGTEKLAEKAVGLKRDLE